MSQPLENELATSGRANDGRTSSSKQPQFQNYWNTLIVEGLETALFTLDRQWRFTSLNSWAAQIWDRLEETLLGKIMWEEFPTLLGTNFENFYRQAMEQTRYSHLEEFSTTTQTWYEVRAYPIPEGLIVHFHDITIRKQLEQALKESEERYRVLSEATFEGVAIQDNGVIVEANGQLSEMLGYSPQELSGKPISQFLAPESRPALQEDLADNANRVALRTCLRKDGSQFFAEARRKPLEYQGRSVWLVAIRDVTESKRKEQALRESEESFRLLVEGVEDYAIFLLDPQGKVSSWNRGAEKIKGYQAQEILGQSYEIFYSEEDRVQGIPSQILEITLTTGHYTGEGWRIRQDGSRFWGSVAITPFYYDGRLRGFAKIVRDITETRRKEQALRESEYRFKVLSNATREGILIHEHGTILVANESMAHMFGFNSPEELVGTSVFDLIAPESQELARTRSEQGIEMVYEFVGLKRDGLRFPVEVFGKNVEFQGQMARQGAFRDLTELKRKEQQLRDSEERYRVLSEAAYEGLVISDGKVVLDANRRLAEMLGYSLEELIGMPSEKLLAPESFPAMRERIASNNTAPFETIALRKDGSKIVGETRGSIIEYKGRTTRLMAIRDLTEIKQAQEALEKTQAQLLQSQKMEGIGRLAGGVAHDFNNILTAIIGYTDIILLKMDETNPHYNDMLEIEKAAERASSFTRQLLLFSRQQVLQPKRLNLNQTIIYTSRFLERLLGEDVELVALTDPDLGEVMADPGQVEQVIMNLVVNARDAMPDGGKLTIETANVELDEAYRASGHPQLKTGSYVMLAVSDTGTGMDEATQQRIFEPFFTTKEAGKGTGLGLATVFGIVSQSDGYIMVYSELGIGTTFKIYLPRAKKALPMAESQTTSRKDALLATLSRRSLEGRKVLVVEDDELVRAFIQRILGNAGYTLFVAQNGEEAIEILTSQGGAIDLVISDIVMPKMGGRELIAHLKERWPGLNVLCMSGYTDRSVERHNILSECTSFLQKPFTSDDLLKRIESMLKDSIPPSATD